MLLSKKAHILHFPCICKVHTPKPLSTNLASIPFIISFCQIASISFMFCVTDFLTSLLYFWGHEEQDKFLKKKQSKPYSLPKYFVRIGVWTRKHFLKRPLGAQTLPQKVLLEDFGRLGKLRHSALDITQAMMEKDGW